MLKKIKTQKEIIRIVDNLKKEGKRIVTSNGSFDMLHAGHVRSLEEAKKQGDVLIVAVNSDSSVRLYKGPNRPIVPERERAEILSALAPVDYVALFDEINPKAILEKIKPHVHCNGSDWGKHCVEREVVERHGGKIHVLRWTESRSTTDSIKRIQEVSAKKDIRAVFLDRDGTINQDREGYTYTKKDFLFLPGVIPALKKFSKTGFTLIVITNQSGIGRGYYTEKDMRALHQWMISEVQKKGGRIDAIYHCPHTDVDGCICRKPKIDLFLRAAQDFGINLSKSWFVGDSDTDVIAGREANVRTIKIGGRMPKALKLEPNFYAKDLEDAAQRIIRPAA